LIVAGEFAVLIELGGDQAISFGRSRALPADHLMLVGQLDQSGHSFLLWVIRMDRL
jgi:hypothetical protein